MLDLESRTTPYTNEDAARQFTDFCYRNGLEDLGAENLEYEITNIVARVAMSESNPALLVRLISQSEYGKTMVEIHYRAVMEGKYSPWKSVLSFTLLSNFAKIDEIIDRGLLNACERAKVIKSDEITEEFYDPEEMGTWIFFKPPTS